MTLAIYKTMATTPGSNKPPAAPPSPDPTLFSEKIVLTDGRVLWATRPLPDRLTLVAYLQEEHFGGAGGLAQKLPAFAAQLVAAGKGMWKPDGSLMARAHLSLGDRGSVVDVTLSRLKVDGDFAYRLRLECNPRKLGVNGCKELIATLAQAGDAPVNVAAILKQAGLRRLDVCVDVAGITPGELVVSCKKKVKSVFYRSADHHLETVQFHREKAKPKKPLKRLTALGKMELKVYDRNREREARGKSPPYPNCTVTRLEVVKTRFPGSFGLSDLHTMADLFATVTVQDRATLNPWKSAERWTAYLTCRSSLGHEGAVSALGLIPKDAALALNAVPSKSGGVLGHNPWNAWTDSLTQTGIGVLIDMAESAAV